MISREYGLQEWTDDQGRSPFAEWVDRLDKPDRGRILTRVARFQLGNFGDHKHVRGGVFEARMDFGPGYRVYFGIEGGALVLLVGGGDKSSQSRDIKMAEERWRLYLKK